MVTRQLPTPVQVVVDSALAMAVRRWPPCLRDELFREWTAELHAIAHEPVTSATARSWRSIAFTVSLACARGIEKEEPVEGRSLMRTTSKPLIGLAVVPVVMAVLLAAVLIVVTILQETFLDPIVSFSMELFVLQDMGSPAAVIAAVGLGLLGRRRARRTPLPFPNPTARAVATVAGLMAGVTALIALTADRHRPARLGVPDGAGVPAGLGSVVRTVPGGRPPASQAVDLVRRRSRRACRLVPGSDAGDGHRVPIRLAAVGPRRGPLLSDAGRLLADAVATARADRVRTDVPTGQSGRVLETVAEPGSGNGLTLFV